MMKIVQLTALIFVSCVLASCDRETETMSDASAPELPPLTYTWSHPDCPFTVQFPGKPEVEASTNGAGILTISAFYETDQNQYYFLCEPNILEYFTGIEEYSVPQLLKLYTENHASYTKTVVIAESYKQTSLSASTEVSTLFTILSAQSQTNPVYSNTITLSHSSAMGLLSYIYTSSNYIESAGNDFLQKVKLK